MELEMVLRVNEKLWWVFLYLIWKINPGFDSDILVISMVLDEWKLPKHSEKVVNNVFFKS